MPQSSNRGVIFRGDSNQQFLTVQDRGTRSRQQHNETVTGHTEVPNNYDNETQMNSECYRIIMVTYEECNTRSDTHVRGIRRVGWM